MNIKKMDRKLKNSFRQVRSDVLGLHYNQREILRRIENIERVLMNGSVQRSRTSYIGNLKTRDLHDPNCILARGSRIRDNIRFPTRQMAREAGFSECVCLA